MSPRASVSDSENMSVTVRIMGREYTVLCPQEEHEALVASADFLNERMSAIRKRGKALGAERIAVMADYWSSRAQTKLPRWTTQQLSA